MGTVPEGLQASAVVRPGLREAPPRYVARAVREAFGKSLRERVKRIDQDRWIEPSPERDLLARLTANETGRTVELLPARHARMATSPFGFLRGAAAIMAPDLAAQPSTGYAVQLCGDAHVRNLGAYANPDGTIVFDINDFDETCIGPWEWDLKRLAISVILVGREAGTPDKGGRDAVEAMIRSWRTTMRDLAGLPACDLARYRVHRFGEDGPVRRLLDKAERITAIHARDQLTRLAGDGTPRFVCDGDKLRAISDDDKREVLGALAAYRDTLGPNRQLVFDCYLPTDAAAKLAGTGSVGCRNYVVACIGNGIDDPLILQVKEALPSCYHALGLIARDARVSEHDGKRVAEGQHRMQTWTDPFLGWTTVSGRPCYVRQLSDHKASIDAADLRRNSLVEYARVCGEVFAKAHARTADAAVLSGYAGDADKLDLAIGKLAIAGADQVTHDWETLVGAIKRGTITTLPA